MYLFGPTLLEDMRNNILCEEERIRIRRRTTLSYPKIYIFVLYCRLHNRIDAHSQYSSYSFILAINVHVNFTHDWKYRMACGMCALSHETGIRRLPNSIFIIILCLSAMWDHFQHSFSAYGSLHCPGCLFISLVANRSKNLLMRSRKL